MIVFGVLVAVSILSQIAVERAGAEPEGIAVELSASGAVKVERGEPFGDVFDSGQGEISIRAVDFGDRVTPLPPHDVLEITARVESGGRRYEVTVKEPMVEDPLGRHGTWWGVGLHVHHHGHSGIGTNRLPDIHSELAGFGLGDVSVDGVVVARGVAVHVMTAHAGIPGRLELDVGDEDVGPIPGLPEGRLRVLWDSYQGDVPEDERNAKWLGGAAVLVALLAGAVWLNLKDSSNLPS
jgi:hypothetical protein